ncbi:hypothetical protein PQR05_29735 [Paraburkholderia sediminicola]|uniref:hypothetical protein n=1 Tax=Paraburkholderia sediminicola TaxID=458836 RepID=UPI0038BD9EAB
MKKLQALLAAFFGRMPKSEPFEPAPDPVAITLEEAVASVRVATANGDIVAFISTRDMSYDLFRQYTEAIRAAFEKDRARTGIVMPRVVILPPGVTVDMVRVELDANLGERLNAVVAGISEQNKIIKNRMAEGSAA